jgi:CRISPR/Cas system-associated exonuclease Cas4 (RecB family)
MVDKKSDLKMFLDTTSKPSRLIGSVERYILSRPPGDRSTTVLHPSEIIKKDWCHRAAYFLLQGKPKAPDRFPLRVQSIFDEGHAIHYKWQRWFQDMGVLYGRFVCSACDDVTLGTSPKECLHCQAPWTKLTYDEVTLYDDALRIKGHTDGWIKGIKEDCLIEIKSIGPGTLRSEVPHLFPDNDGDFMKVWGNIRRPFSPHIMQGQMYLELMKRMGTPVNEIVFLYELKADQSYKEFSVKPDYELVRHVFDAARQVVNAVEENAAPSCNVGTKGSCKQCAPYKEES